MPVIEVDTYTVMTQRNGDVPSFVRKLTLTARNPATAVVRLVFVYFFVDSYGDVGNQQTTFARAYVPISEFDTYYRILQTERPVFFKWLLKDGSATEMRTHWLSTDPESVGEGTTDAT